MPSTYTASADTIVSGGAVQITVPADGDADAAASSNTPDQKLADVVKKLVNQVPMFGVAPSILDTHLTNGLLFAGEVDSLGAALRIYNLDIGLGVKAFFIVYNASWNGTVWARDTNTADAIMHTLLGTGVVSFAVGRFDTTTAATWASSAWDFAALTKAGAAAAAGSGNIVTQTPIAVSGGIGYQNAWVNGTGVDIEGVHYWKDPWGLVHFYGHMKSGTSGSIAFTLPAAYRPAKEHIFAVATANGASHFGQIEILPNGDVLAWFSNAGDQLSLDGVSFR